MTGEAPEGQDKLTFAPPPRSVGGESSADPFIGIPEDDDELEASATRKYPAVGGGKSGARKSSTPPPPRVPAGVVDLDAETTEHKVSPPANDPVAPIKKTMIQQSVPVLKADAEPDTETAPGKPGKSPAPVPSQGGHGTDARDVTFEAKASKPPSVRTTPGETVVPGSAKSTGRVSSPAAALPQPEPVEPKSRAGLLIAVGLIAAVALGGGAFLWIQNNKEAAPETAAAANDAKPADGATEKDAPGPAPADTDASGPSGEPGPGDTPREAKGAGEPAAVPANDAGDTGDAEKAEDSDAADTAAEDPGPAGEGEPEPSEPEPSEPEPSEPEPSPIAGDASLTDARSKKESDPKKAFELAQAVYERHDSEEVDAEALEVMVYAACLIPDGKVARDSFRKLVGKAARRRVIDHCADEKIVVWSNEKGYTKGELARMAAKAFENGDHQEAYDLARDSYKKKANRDAMVVMGKAACKLGNSKKAKLAVAGLPQDQKDVVRSVCSESGTSLD